MYGSIKILGLVTPILLWPGKKEVIEDAYPGDVVGLFDTGNFKIGDTLSQGEDFFTLAYPAFRLKYLKKW